MAFPNGFLDELRTRLPLSEVIRKRVKLTKRGREFLGLCPFHHEKTPSFTVNDDKGFFHCFGCGAHGDVIRFIMETENVPFIEAVEKLAGMAGLKMPEQSPEQAARYARQSGLYDIMENACQFFQKQLFSPNGRNGQQYLTRRGITPAIAKQFRLGYAPSGSKLTAFIKEKGLSLTDCQRLGIIAKNQERNMYHDYFYDRVMFPIINRTGKVIGFGGRLLEKGEPKYLNSPETDLFHKGEQLYALKNALQSIRDKNAAIVVEGYMDVIALHTAGFTNAVAPLGTAFTEKQIQLLWRECDEPFICFDGDTAGRKAGIRALNRFLPILVPGKSLRFVWLPDGLDPDDIIRKRSPQDFQKCLDMAQPMVETLWNYLLDGRSLNTPEQRAKLEQDISDTLKVIQNETVRSYYEKAMKKKVWELNKGKKHTSMAFQTAISLPAPASDLSEGKMVLAYLISYPRICEKLIEEIAHINMGNPELQTAFNQVVDIILNTPDVTPDDIKDTLSEEVLKWINEDLMMLQKSKRNDRDVLNDLKVLIIDTKIKMIQQEIKEKTNHYLTENSPDLWDEIVKLKTALKQEQEKRIKNT